jgi:CRISPR system Cascade subunit CasB
MSQIATRADFVPVYIDRLQELDSGERARFKRNAGMSMDESRNVMGLFYKRLLYDCSLRDTQEEVYFLIATLYPFEKQPKRKRETAATEPPQRPSNLGASLGEIRRRLELKKPGSAAGLDDRFERLLDADAQQLPYYLRREIHFLVNADGRIDWAQLLRDLLRWDYADRRVQRNWARSYFAAPSAEPDSEF